MVGRLFSDDIHVNFTKTSARCQWKPEASSMIKTLKIDCSVNETLNFVAPIKKKVDNANLRTPIMHTPLLRAAKRSQLCYVGPLACLFIYFNIIA